MIAIFGALAAAETYVAAVDAALGYPCAGSPATQDGYGWTTTWATPQQHPTDSLWAVPVSESVTPSVTPVETLDATWSLT